MSQCRKCGALLADPPTGRPPDYCSQACRRLAEFEVRRITRQLDNLDERKTELQQSGVAASSMRDVYGRTNAQQLHDVQGSIEAREKRLRALIGDETREQGE